MRLLFPNPQLIYRLLFSLKFAEFQESSCSSHEVKDVSFSFGSDFEDCELLREVVVHNLPQIK